MYPFLDIHSESTRLRRRKFIRHRRFPPQTPIEYQQWSNPQRKGDEARLHHCHRDLQTAFESAISSQGNVELAFLYLIDRYDFDSDLNEMTIRLQGLHSSHLTGSCSTRKLATHTSRLEKRLNISFSKVPYSRSTSTPNTLNSNALVVQCCCLRR